MSEVQRMCCTSASSLPADFILSMLANFMQQQQQQQQPPPPLANDLSKDSCEIFGPKHPGKAGTSSMPPCSQIPSSQEEQPKDPPQHGQATSDSLQGSYVTMEKSSTAAPEVNPGSYACSLSSTKNNNPLTDSNDARENAPTSVRNRLQTFCADARQCGSDQRQSAFEPSKVTETNSGTTIAHINFLQTVTAVVRERINDERENVFESSKVAEMNRDTTHTSIDSSSLPTVNTDATEHNNNERDIVIEPSEVAEPSSGTMLTSIDSSNPPSVNEMRERNNDDGESIQPNVSTVFSYTTAVNSSNLENINTDVVSENSNDGMEVEPSDGVGTLSQKTNCNNNAPHWSGSDRGEIIRHSEDRTSATTKSNMAVTETSRVSFSELFTTEDTIREKQSAITQTIVANLGFTLPPSVNCVLPYRIPQKLLPPGWDTSAKSQYRHKKNKWYGIHWNMLPYILLEHPSSVSSNEFVAKVRNEMNKESKLLDEIRKTVLSEAVGNNAGCEASAQWRDLFQQLEPDEEQRCKEPPMDTASVGQEWDLVANARIDSGEKETVTPKHPKKYTGSIGHESTCSLQRLTPERAPKRKWGNISKVPMHSMDISKSKMVVSVLGTRSFPIGF